MTIDQTENAQELLRIRIAQLEEEKAELERQLSVQAARTNAAIAAAQDKVYWLDRWHVDLNRLMRRRGAGTFRATLRVLRKLLRPARRLLSR